MWSVRPACSPRYGVSRSTKRRNLTDQTWVPGEEAGRGERQNKPSSLHFSGKKDSLPTNIELKPPAYHPSRTRLRRKPNQKEGYILMVEKLKFGSLYMDWRLVSQQRAGPQAGQHSPWQRDYMDQVRRHLHCRTVPDQLYQLQQHSPLGIHGAGKDEHRRASGHHPAAQCR